MIPKRLVINSQDQFEDVAAFERFSAIAIELAPYSADQVLLKGLPTINMPISEFLWLNALQDYLTRAPNLLVTEEAMQSDILLCIQDNIPENTVALFNWAQSKLSGSAPHLSAYSDHWQRFAWSISAEELANQIG